VGSSRGALAIQTENYFFVGPDNGVLSWALAKEKVRHIRRLENPKYFLPTVSQTFHGRDVFAPIAAYLSKGISIAKLGPAQGDLVRLPWPEPIRKGNVIEGEVVYIDRFGNAITNVPNSTVTNQKARQGRLALPVTIGKVRCPIAPFYRAVAPGKGVAVPGSTGFLEIAVNGGNASKVLKLRVGFRQTILH
jgi:S-adenosyl-L-methionine hydrolase (adenosine-forming)